MWTVIHFIVRFFQDLAHAAFFAVIEYDGTLKLTKTPTQRIVIWLMVAGLTLLAIIVLIMLIRHGLEALVIPGI